MIAIADSESTLTLARLTAASVVLLALIALAGAAQP